LEELFSLKMLPSSGYFVYKTATFSSIHLWPAYASPIVLYANRGYQNYNTFAEKWKNIFVTSWGQVQKSLKRNVM